VYVDGDTGLPVDVGPTGVSGIETIAWDLPRTMLYAIDADTLGILNLQSGAFTAVSASTIASAANPMTGSAGNITTIDADSMSFDPVSGNLYAANRLSGALDLLFIIDLSTGVFVPDAFGSGVDYVVVASTSLGVEDVDGISFDPVSGSLYAVINDSGSSDHLTIIDKANGSVTDIGIFANAAGTAITDVEGLSFFEDGTLHVVTGSASADTAQRNTLWVVDPATALTTEIVSFQANPPGLTYGDYESIACRVSIYGSSVTNIPPTPSEEVVTYLSGNLGGLVWVDLNGDGVQDVGEPGLGGVAVFIDANGNGMLDIGEHSAMTDGFGVYRIIGLTNATYTVIVDESTLPSGYSVSTHTSLELTISDNTLQLDDADFGFRPPPDPENESSVAGSVWNDADEDGNIESGEAPLVNVTVNLYKDLMNDGLTPDDILIFQTVTGINGEYIFDHLYV